MYSILPMSIIPPALAVYFMTSGIRERRAELRAIEKQSGDSSNYESDELSIKKSWKILRSLVSKKYHERYNPLDITSEVYKEAERYWNNKKTRNVLLGLAAFTAPDIINKPKPLVTGILGVYFLAILGAGIVGEITGNIRKKNLEKMMEEEQI